MKLREQLLASLGQARYRPATAAELARQFRLTPGQIKPFDQLLRHLLAEGRVSKNRDGRITLASRGKDLVGRIRFRASGSAYVLLDPPPAPAKRQDDVQIAAADTGVALPGDQVAVRLTARKTAGKHPGPVGRVVHVLSRAHETVVGNLQPAGRLWVVVPDDPNYGRSVEVAAPARGPLQPPPQAGDKVVVRLNPWQRREDPLTGTLVRSLGRTHEPQAELLGLFEKFHLDHQFPADVLQEAGRLPARTTPAAMAGRLKHQQVPTFTIDPDDAKDFDDALSIETLGGQRHRVGIHIADVSAYVQPGTPLDREASRRGNSTYLVGAVVPMLPEKLSNGLCSLVEAEDRLTLSVFLTFDRDGRIVQTDFARTVIRSRKRLTYRQAHAMLFEDDLRVIRNLPMPASHQTGATGMPLRRLPDAELKLIQSNVRQLWQLAARLRRDRLAKGSLDLNMPETKIRLDVNGRAERLERIEQDESHQLVEEFMLAANTAVAHLTRTRHLASLYRVHDAPDPERLAELRDTLAASGIKTGDLNQRREVVRLLTILREHPQGHVLRTLLLRSLRKACYRAASDGHYGLNMPDYTHFTSPIRRYADLVVHRVLTQHLAAASRRPAAPPPYLRTQLDRLAQHLSLTEANSQDAERESVKIKLLEYFERELLQPHPASFAAIITEIRPHGFFIELTESLAFGLVPAARLRGDHFHINRDGTALVGRRLKTSYALGDRISVVVDKVDRFKRLVDFRPDPAGAHPA